MQRDKRELKTEDMKFALHTARQSLLDQSRKEDTLEVEVQPAGPSSRAV